MKNMRIAFELYETDTFQQDAIKHPKQQGYQQIDCYVIFDIKMGENFCRKARIVAGGHQTSTLLHLIYSSVVSYNSIRLAFTLAALNNLEILAYDI